MSVRPPLRTILTLPPYLRLRLPSCHFPSGFSSLLFGLIVTIAQIMKLRIMFSCQHSSLFQLEWTGLLISGPYMNGSVDKAQLIK
jgi:hypothetical protein